MFKDNEGGLGQRSSNDYLNCLTFVLQTQLRAERFLRDCVNIKEFWNIVYTDPNSTPKIYVIHEKHLHA